MKIRFLPQILISFCIVVVAGCYAPLRSPAIRASALPNSFRHPDKACQQILNLAALTSPVPSEWTLGPKDIIRVDVSDLTPNSSLLTPSPGLAQERNAPPFLNSFEVTVSDQGRVLLPLIGNLDVGGKTIEQAREYITEAYSHDYIDDPQIAITLVREGWVNVVVMGEVVKPGVYELPKYQNDVAHALAMAGGLTQFSAGEIQVQRHRKQDSSHLESNQGCPQYETTRIPIATSQPNMFPPEKVVLAKGDIVFVPRRKDEVFFVVGKLSTNNSVRFSLGRETRDIGNGFVLPPDRDIDVVTAVAMAGYIDPIDSPTTVTVHRMAPNGQPLLVRVDLIAARYDSKENILVKAGDIIYLNPDTLWWMRRSFDRLLPTIFSAPYTESVQRLIDPRGLN